MNAIVDILIGPLGLYEASRSVRKGWLFALEALVVVIGFFVVLGVEAAFRIMTSWSAPAWVSPYESFHSGLGILIGIEFAIALVLVPALAAGSLAGEKERGTLGLLLSTRVSAWEIVAARLSGRLGQIGFLLLSLFPLVVWFGVLSGLSPVAIGLCLLIPLVVAWGTIGVSLAASVLSRRGRDALIVMYLVEILAILLIGWFPSLFGIALPAWLEFINPFMAVPPLSAGKLASAEVGSTLLFWSLLGSAGLAVAAWRLRPVCLKMMGGTIARRRSRRGWGIPRVPDFRPMVWKELWIERVGTLGGFGRLLIGFLVLLVAGTAVVLGLLVAAGLALPNSDMRSWGDWAMATLSSLASSQAIVTTWLIEWAIGLRAAAAISSERERGTWDAILTSPLSPTEIVHAKLGGSMFALRWLIGASLLFSTIAISLEAMSINAYIHQILEILIVGFFMAVIGLRVSLEAKTATKAMGITIAAWMIAKASFAIVAFIAAAFVMLFAMLAGFILQQYGILLFANPRSAAFLLPISQQVIDLLLFLLAGLGFALQAGFRFDRLAGRFVEGRIGVALDQILVGKPLAPVALSRLERKKKPKAPAEPQRAPPTEVLGLES